MATTFQQKKYETIVTVISSGGALTNTSREISAAQGGDATDANLLGDWELVASWSVAPTVDTFVDLYLVRAADGTNYEDGDASIRPSAEAYVGSFQVRAVTTSQRMTTRDVPFPPGLYKALVWNNSGQTMSATWTLKVRPHNLQNV